MDDDPIAILVCETLLRKTNYAEQIVSFKDAREGLAFFEKRYAEGQAAPATLFLDVIMPVMDGWDFLEAYTKLSIPDPNPHILMLSAMFNPVEKEKAVSNPLVLDFISKPITKEVLDTLSTM